MAQTLLKVTGLKVAYGGIQAVKGVDFEVREGELVTLIGSNGAGKTTTMKAITGTLPMNAGDIEYLGKSIRGKGAWDLVKQGLAMVPEGRGVFTRMTITENLQMGAHIRNDKPEIAADLDKVFTIFPRLKERRDQLAGTMSGGEQQMLAMGRALMSRPKVLLLDEPSMGLSPIMVDKIFEVVREVYAQGVTVLLVEQNASRALQIADRGYVMESGIITMSGDAKQTAERPQGSRRVPRRIKAVAPSRGGWGEGRPGRRPQYRYCNPRLVERTGSRPPPAKRKSLLSNSSVAESRGVKS